MKKHIILALIIIGAFASKSIAQTEYFYEFSVPGLTTKTDAANIKSAIQKLGITDSRVDDLSGKVLCFSNNSLSATDFSEKLNANNYYIFFFNSGVQGTDQHLNKSIEEWNKINVSNSSEKVFVALGSNIFVSTQKQAIKTLLESKTDFISLKYSNDNKKLLIYTNQSITRSEIKSLLYSYNSPNKLTDLIEINK
jgi:hypothetical protein